MVEVFAFECRHKAYAEGRIINAESRGKALYEYFLDVREPWPDVKWTDLRCRRIGGPKADEMFRHVAELRGMPDLEPGERITSKYGDGVIVGAGGGGANFKILFDSGKFAGQKLIVHPMEFKRVAVSADAGK